MLTKEELEAFLHTHGWGIQWVKRNQTHYAYAKKRVGKRVLGRYLKSERQIDKLTPEFILKRIQL
jgi:hypothetical protein